MNTLFNNTMYNYFKSTNIHKKKKKVSFVWCPPTGWEWLGPLGTVPWALMVDPALPPPDVQSGQDNVILSLCK